MHGHHPHLALAVLACVILLALDLDLAGGDPGEEALQVVCARGLGGQGLGQEGVEGVLAPRAPRRVRIRWRIERPSPSSRLSTRL